MEVDQGASYTNPSIKGRAISARGTIAEGQAQNPGGEAQILDAMQPSEATSTRSRALTDRETQGPEHRRNTSRPLSRTAPPSGKVKMSQASPRTRKWEDSMHDKPDPKCRKDSGAVERMSQEQMRQCSEEAAMRYALACRHEEIHAGSLAVTAANAERSTQNGRRKKKRPLTS